MQECRSFMQRPKLSWVDYVGCNKGRCVPLFWMFKKKYVKRKSRDMNVRRIEKPNKSCFWPQCLITRYTWDVSGGCTLAACVLALDMLPAGMPLLQVTTKVFYGYQDWMRILVTAALLQVKTKVFYWYQDWMWILVTAAFIDTSD